LKILFVHNRYLQSSGGEDAAVEAEAKLLSLHGHETDVLLFDNADMGKGFLQKINTAFRTIYNPASADKLRQKIRTFRPDLIHVHNFFFMASPSVILEAYKSGLPVVVTLHNFRLICVNAILLRENKVCQLCVNKTFPWSGVVYKCYHDSRLESVVVGSMGAVHKIFGHWKNKVSRYITPSHFMKERLVHSSLDLHPDKVFVKPNFMDDPGFSSGNSRENFFLFVGRLSPEKGVSILLEAFSKIPSEKLIIIGDGPEKEFLQTTYGHFDNLVFLGKKEKPEVMQMMKQSRALFFPSIWFEGLPLTIVEAFATGTPVIGSDLGAMREMIQPGVNGFLFQPGDVGSLMENLNKFNSIIQRGDEALYAGARASYEQIYHPQKCYDQVMQIYNEVLTEKKNEHSLAHNA
jgi:glycosyltransferase involved in cell wall biosynthesis